MTLIAIEEGASELYIRAFWVNIVKNVFNHPSIIKIKQKFKLSNKFSFHYFSGATVKKVLKKMPSDKAAAVEIPVNVLKNIVKFASLN